MKGGFLNLDRIGIMKYQSIYQYFELIKRIKWKDGGLSNDLRIMELMIGCLFLNGLKHDTFYHNPFKNECYYESYILIQHHSIEWFMLLSSFH